ncbi:hypothetical protein WN48_00101 [Eufriesea mexicana]|nr:hypothetical protein WN48_00101 [Eufriesea mexicana]
MEYNGTGPELRNERSRVVSWNEEEFHPRFNLSQDGPDRKVWIGDNEVAWRTEQSFKRTSPLNPCTTATTTTTTGGGAPAHPHPSPPIAAPVTTPDHRSPSSLHVKLGISPDCPGDAREPDYRSGHGGGGADSVLWFQPEEDEVASKGGFLASRSFYNVPCVEVTILDGLRMLFFRKGTRDAEVASKDAGEEALGNAEPVVTDGRPKEDPRIAARVGLGSYLSSERTKTKKERWTEMAKRKRERRETPLATCVLLYSI